MKKILAAALLASVATSAFAADLPTRKGPAPAPVYYAPPFTWTGFYIGVNGGYGYGDLSNAGTTVFGHPDGGMIGGTAGYNYQIGQFVVGAEGTLDWADLQNKRTFADGSTSKATVDSIGNILARAGVAYDRALFYVAGGYAGGNVEGQFYDSVTGGAYSHSAWQNGWAVGGGIEYAVTNNVSLKAEYIFSQLNDRTYFAGTPDVVKTGVNINSFKTGVNYKF